MKAKYIEATEIVKPGKTAWKYVGIELERDKEKVSLLGVGGSDWDDISVEDFEFEKYNFKVTDKERVHHLFSVALKEQQAECLNAEISLLKARRNLQFHHSKIKQYFGKPLSIGALDQEVSL